MIASRIQTRLLFREQVRLLNFKIPLCYDLHSSLLCAIHIYHDVVFDNVMYIGYFRSGHYIYIYRSSARLRTRSALSHRSRTSELSANYLFKLMILFTSHSQWKGLY